MDKKKKFIISGSAIVIVIAIILTVILFNKKEPITYNVSFETNGGTKVSSQIINEGKLVQKPIDPTKEGYIFIEWTYKGKTYDFSLEVTSNLVLTAKWEKTEENIETFVVKFDSDGGTTISNQIVEKGNKVAKPVDPIKDGYTFKGWTLNNEIYDFETIVEDDLELKASWEKEEVNNTTTSNNNTSNKNNTSNNNSSSSNNQPIETPKNEVKLTTPTITKTGFGVGPEGAGINFELNIVEEITGVEVYVSELADGKYTLNKTVLKKDLINGKQIEVTAQKGQHLYFKVRTYVETSVGKFYSGYSNVIEFDYSLTTPTLTKVGFGVGPDGAGMDLELDIVEEITGVEVYASDSADGKYTLNKTVLIEDLINGNQINVTVQQGQHLYFKVKTYVKNSAGTFYSGYSNIIDLAYLN